jgi:hypothetical protein
MNDMRLHRNARVLDAKAEQSVGPSLAQADRGGNEAVRDFFRRGDRGLYEGGPAEHALDSLPSWDVPERAPIVRTPQQQARRIAMMWAEAAFMVGCVALMVTAALKASNHSSPQSTARNVEQSTRQAAAQPLAEAQSTPARTAPPAAAKLSAPPTHQVAINAQPRVPSEQMTPRAPAVTEVPQSHPLAANMASPERRKVAAVPTQSNLEHPRAKSPRATFHVAPVAARTEPPPSTASAPRQAKRAVAAFPDD